MTTNLAASIADRAAASPALAIFRFLERGETEQEALSYAQLDHSARHLAGSLIERMGGERVLLVFEPGREFVEALVACLYAGIVAIPAPAPRRGASLQRLEGIIAGAGARFVLTSAALKAGFEAESSTGVLSGTKVVAFEDLERGAAAPRMPGFDLKPEDPVFIQYTSGSTLAPRGVVLNSACVLANVGWTCRGTGFGASGPETFVNWMPHYHDMGLIGGLVIPLTMGFETVHLPPLAFIQSPARWLQAIDRYRGTSSGGPPLAYDLCVSRVSQDVLESLDLSCWRTAYCGAEPVFNSTLEGFARRFAGAGFDRSALFNVYGLAEVTVYAGGSPSPGPGDAAAEPLDRAPCHLDAESLQSIRIVSAEGKLVPDGSEGEIWISHPSAAAGYLGDAEASERTFGQRLQEDDGRLYLRTGDLGILSGSILTITGRIKDVLIRNGANIAPADVERLATHGLPFLNRNGAAAFEGEGASAPIILLVELERGVDFDAAQQAEATRSIRKSVADTLGIRIDEIGFVEPGALARTTSGKVQRSRVRAGWLAAAGQ